MKLTAKQKRRICEVWAAIDDGDMSTERLFAMTCERAGEDIRRELNDVDVCEALAWAQKAKVRA